MDAPTQPTPDDTTSSIAVASGADRPTPREQIARVCELAKAAGEPVRVRVPVTLLDLETKNYFQVRETFWKLEVPGASVETLEIIVEALGKCMALIGEEGPLAVIGRLGTKEG